MPFGWPRPYTILWKDSRRSGNGRVYGESDVTDDERKWYWQIWELGVRTTDFIHFISLFDFVILLFLASVGEWKWEYYYYHPITLYIDRVIT